MGCQQSRRFVIKPQSGTFDGREFFAVKQDLFVSFNVEGGRIDGFAVDGNPFLRNQFFGRAARTNAGTGNKFG